MALLREGLDEIPRIGALDRAGRRKHGDEAGTRALGGGLDRRHRADEGLLRKGGAQIGTDQREGGIAGDDADFRIVFPEQPAERA